MNCFMLLPSTCDVEMVFPTRSITNVVSTLRCKSTLFKENKAALQKKAAGRLGSYFLSMRVVGNSFKTRNLFLCTFASIFIASYPIYITALWYSTLLKAFTLSALSSQITALFATEIFGSTWLFVGFFIFSVITTPIFEQMAFITPTTVESENMFLKNRSRWICLL